MTTAMEPVESTINRDLLTEYTRTIPGQLFEARASRTKYTYDGMRIESVTYPNGVVETRDYDDAGRLDLLATKDSAEAPLLGFSWIRDGEGNPTSVTETGALHPTLEQLAVQYEYDTDNRLTDSSQGLYQHDANGNLTSRTVKGTTTTFTYDNEDRLTSQTTGKSTVQHVYDGDGHRVARIDNGTETRYVLDRGRGMSHILCETDPNGVIAAYYIQGPQLVTRIGADGSQCYYHTNDIGSVVALTDENEQVTDRYGYTPFGLLRSQEGTSPNPFTYVGGLGVMVEADGLYFMRARFYDPDTGRFFGKDPVEGMFNNPQGLHRYVYGLNNPLTLVDPRGTYAGATAMEGLRQAGLGLLNVAGGMMEIATGAVSAGAGIGVPILLKGANTGVQGVTQVFSGIENITYRATMNQSAVDNSVNLAEEWLAATGNKQLENAYHAVDASLDIINLALAFDSPFGMKRGGGNRMQQHWMRGSTRAGQYMKHSHAWLSAAWQYTAALSPAFDTGRRLGYGLERLVNVPYLWQIDPFRFYRWTKNPN